MKELTTTKIRGNVCSQSNLHAALFYFFGSISFSKLLVDGCDFPSDYFQALPWSYSGPLVASG